MQDNVVDIHSQNAKQLLVDESFNRPVLVDFWADWCGPCKSLTPVLEKLADEYAGAFLLAKVNVDHEQMIASQFGVRSLPTVVLMKDGQPIDGFTGAQTEVEVRKLLDTHLPKPWDLQLQQGRALLEEGAAKEAVAVLRPAYLDSGERADIACALARAYLLLNRLDDAKKLLDGVRMVDQGPEYDQVRAQWELAINAEKAPEISALEDKLRQSPEDEAVIYDLALQYAQHHYHREALELLLGLLQRNLAWRDGDARRAYTDILAVLGKGDPLAAEFQRKLYSLIY